MIQSSSRGYISLSILLLLLFISLILSSMIYFYHSSLLQSHELKTKIENTHALQNTFTTLLSFMHTSSSPYSDSQFDAWNEQIKELEQKTNSFISILPISDKININHATVEFLSNKTITNTLKRKTSMTSSFQEYRFKHGISLDFSGHYQDFFTDPSFLEHTSPWTWCNINNSDLFVIELLLSSDNNEQVIQHIKQSRAENEMITSIGRLPDLNKAEDVGILATASLYNVNYIEESLLWGIIEYIGSFTDKKRSIANPESVYTVIIAERRENEITPEALVNILKPEIQPHPIFSYLGTITWFWKITISTSSTTLEAVICKVPAPENPLYTGNITKSPFIELPYSVNEPLHVILPDDKSMYYQVVSMRTYNE